ncbi:hypothetical protein K469DRAFT_704419 [Zopfia rhizophila CBS 207.26]|uniref:Uncharacterized protein n=1 Tax=Zopfia rhizophila CBS 207.26 TaxID=1314779 RepID=A0A6A6D965_9PEZI|nr:hypothetical protein K469DRAFT_704419 [Zopfia rhizophila CBS 207.26]
MSQTQSTQPKPQEQTLFSSLKGQALSTSSLSSMPLLPISTPVKLTTQVLPSPTTALQPQTPRRHSTYFRTEFNLQTRTQTRILMASP